MRDFFPKLPAPLSQIRKTKGLAGNKSKVGGYVSEELSLRGREESRALSLITWLSADVGFVTFNCSSELIYVRIGGHREANAAH